MRRNSVLPKQIKWKLSSMYSNPFPASRKHQRKFKFNDNFVMMLFWFELPIEIIKITLLLILLNICFWNILSDSISHKINEIESLSYFQLSNSSKISFIGYSSLVHFEISVWFCGFWGNLAKLDTFFARNFCFIIRCLSNSSPYFLFLDRNLS